METTELAFLRANSVEHINTFSLAEGARFPWFSVFFLDPEWGMPSWRPRLFRDESQDAKGHAEMTTEL